MLKSLKLTTKPHTPTNLKQLEIQYWFHITTWKFDVFRSTSSQEEITLFQQAHTHSSPHATIFHLRPTLLIPISPAVCRLQNESFSDKRAPGGAIMYQLAVMITPLYPPSPPFHHPCYTVVTDSARVPSILCHPNLFPFINLTRDTQLKLYALLEAVSNLIISIMCIMFTFVYSSLGSNWVITICVFLTRQ